MSLPAGEIQLVFEIATPHFTRFHEPNGLTVLTNAPSGHLARISHQPFLASPESRKAKLWRNCLNFQKRENRHLCVFVDLQARILL